MRKIHENIRDVSPACPDISRSSSGCGGEPALYLESCEVTSVPMQPTNKMGSAPQNGIVEQDFHVLGDAEALGGTLRKGRLRALMRNRFTDVFCNLQFRRIEWTTFL